MTFNMFIYSKLKNPLWLISHADKQGYWYIKLVGISKTLASYGFPMPKPHSDQWKITIFCRLWVTKVCLLPPTMTHKEKPLFLVKLFLAYSNQNKRNFAFHHNTHSSKSSYKAQISHTKSCLFCHLVGINEFPNLFIKIRAHICHTKMCCFCHPTLDDVTRIILLVEASM